MSPAPDNLMDALKEAILERHSFLGQVPYIQALVSGALPLQCYVAQLRSLAGLHATLDNELLQIDRSAPVRLLQSRPSRLAQLRLDLTPFDRQYLPDCLDTIEHTRRTAEMIRLCRLDHPGALHAIVYVFEGTTLGNLMHTQDVLRAFGDQVDGSTHYYSGYGDSTAAYWREFRDAMNTLPMDDSLQSRLIDVAHQVFDHLERLYGSIYPVQEGRWSYTASMLNPEAGHHAVPDNPAEIEAAVVAARRCREEYPYFDARYQERGKSFGKSDAAWLVTLTRLPQTQLIAEVDWLGRMLGNRGMPRITLERQLALLHEELTAAMTGRQYDGLLAAARALQAGRLRRLSAKTFEELARSFETAVDAEEQDLLPRTGELIVSAVCDEADGVIHALTTLLSWLTDRERFSASWVAEVMRTVDKARTELAGNP